MGMGSREEACTPCLVPSFQSGNETARTAMSGCCMQLTVVGVLVAVAGFYLELTIKGGAFEHVYNHQPGKCHHFEMEGGAEDVVILPNSHVLISSGLYYWPLADKFPKPPMGIFMMDLNASITAPVKLMINGDFLQQNSDFTPHGLGHWLNDAPETGWLLYVINHHQEGLDTVESFQYHPGNLSLSHRQTFRHSLFHNLNDLVLVGLDEFYATNDRYCVQLYLHTIETILRLPLGTVTYYNGRTNDGKVALSGARFPNGIAQSNNGRFIYVNELTGGKVVAYRRATDDSLTFVQSLPLQIGMDNVVVDKRGHLWLGIVAQLDKFSEYYANHSVPVPSRILHVTVDEESTLPFTNSQIEEVFASKGDIISVTSVGAYHNGRLVVGTVLKDMLLCDVDFLLY